MTAKRDSMTSNATPVPALRVEERSDESRKCARHGRGIGGGATTEKSWSPLGTPNGGNPTPKWQGHWTGNRSWSDGGAKSETTDRLRGDVWWKPKVKW